MDKSQLNIEKVLSSSCDFFKTFFSLEENVLIISLSKIRSGCLK